MLDKDMYGKGFDKMVTTVILGAVVLSFKNKFKVIGRKLFKRGKA